MNHTQLTLQELYRVLEKSDFELTVNELMQKYNIPDPDAEEDMRVKYNPDNSDMRPVVNEYDSLEELYELMELALDSGHKVALLIDGYLQYVEKVYWVEPIVIDNTSSIRVEVEGDRFHSINRNDLLSWNGEVVTINIMWLGKLSYSIMLMASELPVSEIVDKKGE